MDEEQDVAFVIQVGIGETGGFEQAELGLRAGGAGPEDAPYLLTDLRINMLTGMVAGDPACRACVLGF